MKCKICGKKIITRLSKTDIIVDGRSVHVVNLPAFYCPSCDRAYFHEIVIRKAKAYASERNTAQLDYAASENDESDDMSANGIL